MVYFLILSLVPLAAVGILNFRYASKAILKSEAENLEAIVLRQMQEIRAYLVDMENIVRLVSNTTPVQQILRSTTNGPDSPEYQQAVSKYTGELVAMLNDLGYHQLYLTNPNGVVVFSIPEIPAKERDLNSAPYRDYELAKVNRRTISSHRTEISDYRMYPPAGKPQLFISTPVMEQNNLLGTLTLVPDNDELYSAINDYTGLGETGEIILVAADGDQIVLLNDLRYQPGTAFNITVPLHPPEGVDPNPMQMAITGNRGGGLLIDTQGNEVAARWDYLSSLRVGIIVQMAKDEIVAPIRQLAQLSILVGGITLIIVIIVSILVARSITRPITILTDTAERLAQGDLTTEIPVRSENEIGQLSNAARTMAANIKSLAGKVKTSANEIADTSARILQSAELQVSTAESTRTSSLEVNTTARQIASTATELARTMRDVNDVAQNTALRAEKGLDALQKIEETIRELSSANKEVEKLLDLVQTKAQSIGGITITMTKVADQTNLLSLNAAIEARKAGEHGRGFAVVATEIQRLADQTAAATLQIEKQIREMLSAVSDGVKGMSHYSSRMRDSVDEIISISQEITEVIQQVQGLPPRFDQILEGMQFQAEGAGQIHEAMSHLTDSAQQTANAVKETKRLLDNLRRTAQSLQTEIAHFKT